MIQALTKMDPIQQYYVNDNYVKSISSREIKTNTSYSPKALIQGYWKKNYQPFAFLNSSNENQRIALPQINTRSYIISDSKNEENQNDSTNSFTNNINSDSNIAKYKIKPACANYYQMRKEKFSIKIPGKIMKGSFSHNKNIQFRSPKINNNCLNIEQLEIKQSTQSKAIMKSSNSSNSSLENSLSSHKPIHEITKNHKIQNNRPITSVPKHNPEIQVPKPYINTIILQLELLKITNSQINNLALLVFDELLGFQETSYYGFQQDFIQSQFYLDYQNTKDHYFSKLIHNSTIYAFKNLKDLIYALSKTFQLILLTKHLQNQLIEYVNHNKLPITAIYKMKDINQSSINLKALNCIEILNDLQIKKPNKIIFIQTYENLHSTNNPDVKIQEQSIIYPYGIENGINHIYTLILPTLSMQSLLKNDSNQSHHRIFHSLYYIEQFCQTILINCLLDRKQLNLIKYQHSEYIKQLQDKIQFKVNQIDCLKSPQNLSTQKFSKKEMIIRISEKFENSQKYQELSSDLVLRNKTIIKRIGKYKQESINLLLNVKEELKQEFELLNYCQTLLENCYYIIL